MKKVLLAGLAGGIVVFLWSAVSWMALPFHAASLRNVPTPQAEVEGFLSGLGESGVYHYPGMPPSSDQMPEFAERMRRGPRVTMMVYRAEGAEPFPPMNFAINLLAGIASAVIAAALLAAAGIAGYGRRVVFVASLGLFVTLTHIVPAWVWWSYPPSFAVAEVVDALAAWALAGLVIARIVR